MFTKRFKSQKYSSIKSDCLKKGTLFIDPEFPPSTKSLFYSKVDNDIEWKRPGELCKAPTLVVDGVTCSDLNAGELGNNWFISACSALCQLNSLWEKVVPDYKKQEYDPLNPDKYAGVFKFCFWRFGQWMEVVVDDQLPTKDGQLIFCHSKSKNEFWSALLEKAYAKVYGDYESLKSGFSANALVDFTGGVPQKIDMSELDLQEEDKAAGFFGELKDAVVDNKALVLATVDGKMGEEGPEGLILGYSYGVIDVKIIKLNKAMQKVVGTSEMQMVRLRNPWGDKEWSGAWSDGSPEWKNISDVEKKKLGLVFGNEGDFWMSFTDFKNHFSTIDICHFVNTSIFTIKKTWVEATYSGEWKMDARGTGKHRAGGSFHTAPETALENPQYMFDITDNEGDSPMFCLEQEDSSLVQKNILKMGFTIIKVEENRKYRVHVPEPRVVDSPYLAQRAIFLKAFLKKGRYVILPSTHDANVAGRFFLRFYTTKRNGAKELAKQCPTSACPCMPGPSIATVVTIRRVSDLPRKGTKGVPESPNPMVVARCEGESVKTPWFKETTDTPFESRVIFYRKKTDRPIELEVLSRGMISDTFLGLAEVEELSYDQKKDLTLKLHGKKKKERDVEVPGLLHITVESSADLADL